MKIKLFTIPNILTLSNLTCGAIALIEILLYQNFVAAFILIIIAATFDFLDGMAARLLGQYSKIGRELDSLADMVSFGLVPAVAMFSIFNICEKLISCPLWVEWGAYLTLLIACFSALRLARFNVSDDQEDSFVGLPTPANALFCLSITLLVTSGRVDASAELIAAISIVMSILLIAPIRMLALKFKSFDWQANKARYIFLAIAALLLVTLCQIAVPAIIVVYILVSVISNRVCQANKVDKKVNE